MTVADNVLTDLPDGIKRPDWQVEDLMKLASRVHSANWSEMGCFKTSTGLWLAEAKVLDKTNPTILIITSAGGKGTYFDMVPRLLPKFTLFDVGTKALSIVLPGGKRVKLQEDWPKEFKIPSIVLSHYQVFARWNKNKTGPCEQCGGTGEEAFEVAGSNLVVKCENCKGIGFAPLPWTMADKIVAHPWDFVIIDEAHRLKGRDNKWTHCIKRIKSPHKHIMTGTGFINRPDEVWSLLNFLDKSQFGSYNRFVEHFCEIDDYSGYRKITGVKPEEKENFRTLVRAWGVRRSLTEVMPHIKEPIFMRYDVDLSPTQKRMYNEIKMELKALDQKGEPFHSPNVLSALQRMRQICVATPEVVKDEFDPKSERRVIQIRLTEPSSKLDQLMEIIEELQWDEEDKQQVVVFSNFKDPLELLKARLDKASVPYIHMDVGDNDETRYKKWHDIFPKKEHKVFMSTLQLGGESINLTPAKHIVFLDRSWSPKDNAQGIGRVRRPGQEGQPVVINIEAKGTTDQKLERVNKEKQGWFDEIFGAEDMI
jgi:SNF2 family DNA or RNA helicase